MVLAKMSDPMLEAIRQFATWTGVGAAVIAAIAGIVVAITSNEKERRADSAMSKERAARLAIEERLAPRRITPEGAAQVARHLRPFEKLSNGHRQQAFVFATDGQFESRLLADQIAAVLEAAGWYVGRHPVLYGQRYAIRGVGILSTGEGRGLEVAHAVAASLRGIGLDVLMLPSRAPSKKETDGQANYDAAISIAVGERP